MWLTDRSCDATRRGRRKGIVRRHRRWAGFTLVAPNPANNSTYNGGTGVSREYRGRGLALALELLSIRKAHELGAPYMRTDNHAKNAPMLAINRKLGDVPQPGTYQVQKRF